MKEKKNELKPAEPADERIERIAAEGKLETAFRRFTIFASRFETLQFNMAQLQGRLSNLNREERKGGLDNTSDDPERNRIRHSFLGELEDFKRDLPLFLDTSNPDLLLRGVNDQTLIVRDVLGQILRRQYQVGKQIGDGSTAFIFILEDIFTGRKAVAKVLKMPTLTKEIRLEIEKVANLKHRNIIKMIGESLDHFPFFVICEYVSGAMLTDIIQVAGSRPPSQAVKWLLELADALDYLRRKRIEHSNVRPSKIFIDEEQHLVISPFDIIKAGMDDRSLRKFREDCQYLSPEFLDSDNQQMMPELIPASDQFSLGLVAYKMLTGKDLFNGNSVREIILCRSEFFQKEVAREEKLAAITSPELLKIIRKLLEIDPENRYDSLHEVMMELRRMALKNDEEIGLVRNSYERCLARNQQFIEEFYNKFIEGLPERYQQHFQNRQRQNTMLDSAIHLLLDIDNLDKKKLLMAILAGKKSPEKPNRHLEYGLEWYEHFLDTFIQQASKTDRRNWSKEVAEAWQEVKAKALALIRQVMAEGKAA